MATVVNPRRRLRRRRSLVRHGVALTSLVAAAVVLVIILLPGIGRRPPPTVGARACIYPGPTLSDLRQAEASLDGSFHCAMEFDNASTTWAQWEDPWFLTNPPGDANWSGFARSGNRMIITVDLFPKSVDGSDWRPAGASGAYSGYAATLARNLVRGGMGHAVIRLGHEANGTWYADNVGDDAQQEAQWAEFWRRTVTAMRSVPGAHFSFDWCVNAVYRPIPLSAYYPGNAYVDSIGVDVYDAGVPTDVSDRWQWLYDQPEGVGAIARFARAHDKPLAIPEWGLQPRTAGGIGADPGFTRGVLQVLGRNDVSFESYFFTEGPGQALLGDPTSMRLYRSEILR